MIVVAPLLHAATPASAAPAAMRAARLMCAFGAGARAAWQTRSFAAQNGQTHAFANTWRLHEGQGASGWLISFSLVADAAPLSIRQPFGPFPLKGAAWMGLFLVF